MIAAARPLPEPLPEPMQEREPSGWTVVSSTGILAPRLAGPPRTAAAAWVDSKTATTQLFNPKAPEATLILPLDALAKTAFARDQGSTWAAGTGSGAPTRLTLQPTVARASVADACVPPTSASRAFLSALRGLAVAHRRSADALLGRPIVALLLGLSLGLLASLAWHLRPPPVLGQTRLQLASSPAGAQIWAQDALICAATPCELAWAHPMAGGAISLRFVLAGHEEVVVSRRLNGHRRRIAPRLSRIRLAAGP